MDMVWERQKKDGVHTSQLRKETESGRKARVYVRQRNTDGARKKTKSVKEQKKNKKTGQCIQAQENAGIGEVGSPYVHAGV